MSPVAEVELTATFGPVTRTDIVKYAGAGGDFNPLHHDDDYAREVGHPAAFAMGLLTVGYLATAVEKWFGRENVREFGTKFLAPVWVGDVLTCTARRSGSEVQLQVADARGELKVTGHLVLDGDDER